MADLTTSETSVAIFISATEHIAERMDVSITAFHMLFHEDYGRPMLQMIEWATINTYKKESK